MIPPDLIPFLAVFGAIALFVFGVWLLIAALFFRRRERLADRLGEDEEAPGLLEAAEQARRESESTGGFSHLIRRTGLDLTPAAAFAIMMLCGVIAAGAVLIWRLDIEPWLAIPAFFAGAAIPYVFYLWRRGYWRRSVQGQLPDTFFLLSRALRANRTLEGSIRMVGEQGVTPVKEEFARMHRQLELGIPMEQVVRGSAGRVDLVDYNVFASIISLHRSIGGNLPALLDRLALASRDRNQFERQYRSVTIMGRYSAGIIACLVVMILVYFFFYQRSWAARFFDLSMGYTGITMFGLSVGLVLAGLLLMYFLLRHDY